MHLLQVPGEDVSVRSMSIRNAAMTVPVWVRQGADLGQMFPTNHVLLVARFVGLHAVDMAKEEQRDKTGSLALPWVECAQSVFWGWGSVASTHVVSHSHASSSSEFMDELTIRLRDDINHF